MTGGAPHASDPRIPVSAPASLAARAVLWRHRGALRATVVVKATFGLVPDAQAVLVPPQELVTADTPFGKKPTASIRAASDLAPFRPRADVTVVGHACAPPGRPAPAMSVRLGIFRGAPILDKTLHVFGKRAAKSPETPEPFDRMPLRYERAFGGWLSKENPVGIGAEQNPAELPSVIDPRDPRRPAGFGPISCFWWDRLRLLGDVSRSAVEAPIGEIPDDFAWDYFQAAPPDQRVAFLHGDEWIVLDGMHPALPRVRTQLPSARAVARAYPWDAAGPGQPHEIELAADTLAIDADEQRCAVVWRGSLALPRGEQSLGEIRIAAGLGVLGAPHVWPDPRELSWQEAAAASPQVAADEGARTAVLADPERPRGPATPFVEAGASTVHLSEEEQDASARRSVAPFPTAAPGSSAPRDLSATPWSPGATPSAPPQPLVGEQTLMIADLPVLPRPPPVAPPPPAGAPVAPPAPAPAAVAPPPPAAAPLAAAPPVAAPPPSERRPARPAERQRRPIAKGPRAPEAVVASMRSAGLDANDLAALLAALNPPPPPPPPDDED